MRTICDVLFGFTIGVIVGSIVFSALDVAPSKPSEDVDDGRVYFVFVDDKGNKVDGRSVADRIKPETVAHDMAANHA